MPIENVQINNLKIEDSIDREGKPQKKIRLTQFMDQGTRNLTGWVDLIKFNPQDWVNGATISLDVRQKGQYWNFYLPNSRSFGGRQQPNYQQQQYASPPPVQAQPNTTAVEMLAVLKDILEVVKKLLPPTQEDRPAAQGPNGSVADDIPF
jgi:hypothetical protein